MKTNILNIIIALLVSTMLFSCKDEVETTKVNPLEGFIKLEEGYAIGAAAKVEVWGKKNFFMGYNNLTVVLLDSINPTDTLKDAHIYFQPLMTMPQTTGMPMKHACPVENPDEAAINGVFPGAVAFVMPSMGGTWNLGVYVHNHKNDKSGTVNFDITVDSPTTSVMSVFTSQSPDSAKLVLSLLQPLVPQVGMNDIEFTLHKKASMMEWPADSTYTIEIAPEMPSMGHGSPNNVNPVHVGNGHYKGKVNFTMTGEWKINVAVKKDGTTVSKNAYFNITF
ncbi:MAG: FixH family protein [Paludibacter sp.]|nr:FixH family protein [Paludibacter sp.]